MATYTAEFIAVGCNRVGGSLDWARGNRLVAYGGGNFVVLYDVEACVVLTTLPGHEGRVNCVKWVPKFGENGLQQGPEDELMSASSEGLILNWKRAPNGQFEVLGALTGHTGSVTALAIIANPATGTLWIASASADCSVKIWKREGGKWSLFQTLATFKSKPMESLALAFLPGTSIPVLAAGGVDSVIHVFALNDTNQFVRLDSLRGHENWIRCLTFCAVDDKSLLLASSSQDRKIRIWKVSPFSAEQAAREKKSSAEILSSLTSQLNEKADIDVFELFAKEHRDKALTVTRYNFSKNAAALDLESVLSVHEDWVYGLDWAPAKLQNGSPVRSLQLLSASMDKTMIIWEQDPSSGLWIETVRVGEVGGNLLGFYGCKFGPNAEYILGHGYTAAFHVWKRGETSGTLETWDPLVTVSGHFDEVKDIDWDTEGNYLVSVSKDQTARMFGRWIRKENDKDRISWHELARPQVHGYDMSCISFVKGRQHRFVSGAEEKILRVFDATASFVANLSTLSNVQSEIADRPLTANLGPLGLSNKPMFGNENPENDEQRKLIEAAMAADEFEHAGTAEETQMSLHPPLYLTAPPFEEQLLQRTLWAEIQKLYGHGNEMVSVCSNHRGTLLASGCKSKVSPEHAAIRFWDTTTWKTRAVVQVHKSTVTQLEFSHNDQYLLSCSKARSVAVLRVNETNDSTDLAVTMVGKSVAHARMIWTCSWTNDDRFFATGSRDVKSINFKMFMVDPTNASPLGRVKAIGAMTFKQAVSAVAFSPYPLSPSGYVFAVGLENGEISVWHVNVAENKEKPEAAAPSEQDGEEATGSPAPFKATFSRVLTVAPQDYHSQMVRRLRWCPRRESNGSVLLASCSEDFSVRVFRVTPTTQAAETPKK